MDIKLSISEKPITEPGRKKKKIISFFSLFRYATALDWFLMTLGSVSALAHGASLPLFCIIIGNITNALAAEMNDEIISHVKMDFLLLVYLGIASLAAAWTANGCWMVAGDRQAIKFRKEYFRALLRQEMGWFDTIIPSEFSSKVANECFLIQNGIGEKVVTVIYSTAVIMIGFVIAFLSGWQLSLVLCTFIPLFIFCAYLYVYAIKKQSYAESESYSAAGALVEQALCAIRTVVGLCGEEHEHDLYSRALHSGRKIVIKFGVFSAFAFGLIFGVMTLDYTLGFWVGGTFVGQHQKNPLTGAEYRVGDIVTIFFAVTVGASSMTLLGPAIRAITQAREAGTNVLGIINRESQINYEESYGVKLYMMAGEIAFHNVHFSFPSNKQQPILEGLDLVIKPNTKVALVGESGCGKSSCMQLIQRFYDPDQGKITLDGKDLRALNVRWLRSQISYVGQEPVLFSGTVRDNMKLAKLDATDEEIIEALKKANAWEFLPKSKKLDTYVGIGGTQLSGGQKQRIAIARAILKNAKILLLDEATSALDRTNENEIQKTLDEMSKGRTTIVIAHWLSSIENCDRIFFLGQGKVIELGTHEELMALRKHYFDMETAQVPESGLATPADSFSIDIDGKASIEKWLEISVSNRRPPSRRNSSSDMYVEIKKPPKKTLSEPSLSKLLIQKMRPQHRRERKERKAIMRRLRAYSHPERWYLRAAFILSLINGALLPLYALVFSHTLETIMGFEEPHYSSELRFLALMFLMFAVVTFVSYGLSLSFFSVVAEHMTTRIRSEVYEKMLRMHIAWHDDPKHNPGALSSKLATDATAVTTLTSTGVGAMLQMTSSFIISTVLSFIGSWKLALIALGLSPLMIITGELNIHFAAKFSEKNDEAFKEAGAIMIEALNNMRTVISLGREKEILAMYSKVLEKPEKMAIKRGLISGFLLGISEVIMFVIVGIIYFLGAVFIKVYGDGLEGIFHTTFETMYGFLSIETVMPLVPDAARAINSAKSLFKILDTNSDIDYKNPDEKSLQPIEGKIEFRRVSFRYPNQEKQLFSDLSFKIPKGAKIALVGASGCGKTTIMQLLLRYYDVEKGEILLDGKNIKEYDIHHLRNHFGYVSQEPVIFNGTIEENIK
mgnify:FL=1